MVTRLVAMYCTIEVRIKTIIESTRYLFAPLAIGESDISRPLMAAE